MATFTRLRDKSWGIRGAAAEVTRGAILTVTNSANVTSRVRVERIIWTDRAVSIASISTLPDRPGRSARENDYGADEGVLADAGLRNGSANGHAVVAPAAKLPAATVEPVLPPVIASPQSTPDDSTSEEQSRFQACRPCLLIYDIPSSVSIANPSGFLRRRAVRVNLSCWVIPEERIPYKLLTRLREAGCTWHVVRFDATEADKLIVMVRQSLAKQAEEAVLRLGESIDGVEPREGEAGLETADRLRSRTRQAEKRVRELLADLETAAKSFGIARDVWDARAMTKRLAIVTERATRKAAAYVAGTAAMAAIDPKVAALAEADDVEPGMLLDLLEEGGVETAEMRDAFRDE